MMKSFALAASTALASATLWMTPAFAQDAAPQTAQPDYGSDIIVTATRRETTLQSTPIAVSAFGQAQLDRQQVKDVTDLARFVPSLQFNQQGDQSAVLLTLRGIGNDSAYTEVADPEVAIYVDGIYSPRAQGASVLMYDMERVEVLRGPQGTLFGRNATVGALSLISAKPKLGEFGGNVEVVAGNYDRLGVRGAINIPVTDTLAFRVAFVTDRHDGYADFQPAPDVPGINRSAFITTGKKYYAADQQSGRVSMLWQPSERFSWNLSAEGFLDNGAPVIGLLQTPRPGTKRWSTLSDTAPDTDRYSVAVRSTMNYDVTDGIQLSYIAGWSRIGGSTQTDADAGALPPTGQVDADGNDLPLGAFGENRTLSSRYDFQSHEVQLKSTGEQAIDWILGAYYSHEKNRIRFDIDQRNGYRDGTFSWAGSFIQANRQIDSRAVFGQAVWHVSDALRVTGGLRYTSDKKEDIGGRNVTFSGCPATLPADACQGGIFGAYPNATADELAALLPGFSISSNDVKGKWDKLTYLARVDADLAEDVLGYASISTGFKSGNIQDNAGLTDPETLTNYEVGLKSRFLDRRVTLNLAAYYSDFKGYQVNQAVTFRDDAGNVVRSQMITQNAKGAKAYGLEAEMVANLTDSDRLQFSGTLQKTKLEELESVDGRLYDGGKLSSIAQLKGNELAHAPRFSATLSYEHDFELASGAKITPRFTTHYETKSWLSYFNGDANPFVNPNDPADNMPNRGTNGTDWDRQKAYFRSDASIRFVSPDQKYSVEAFVQNIENGKIRTGAGSFGAPRYDPVFLSNLQPPRTWGVRARANF
ncbi:MULTISPECIES: TonB-dependent receptor [unclassified Sphingobium]|jgi:iron complex outermembrane receptor protein|uniref:TonB-dependent receptor n=1 Tax=unclassified Sphingobium TaxID=2611147 RepID=UPI0005CBB224|nr:MULTISPECIES: TonB-dependent receptor [unclassified Sphingobium]AJR23982.1 TonB-dependent receptor [Sphingobium sp. YBL2]PNQ02436.1 TonB-dependent receptor [Sphingobium sp. SA916]UXC92783.1 TonB-dependent receptor [Sphingobium sp. RSMS]